MGHRRGGRLNCKQRQSIRSRTDGTGCNTTEMSKCRGHGEDKEGNVAQYHKGRTQELLRLLLHRAYKDLSAERQRIEGTGSRSSSGKAGSRNYLPVSGISHLLHESSGKEGRHLQRRPQWGENTYLSLGGVLDTKGSFGPTRVQARRSCRKESARDFPVFAENACVLRQLREAQTRGLELLSTTLQTNTNLFFHFDRTGLK
ncbi:hypothetical protein EDD16DRAFT_1725432 [Pisolithus croceorrhizus]|nr:hypothetical protein EDD16DRAFT_1725432 [Pisolithus croceorrhizus]KAI6166014.1 hypothetical protein EDD17DRAFT_116303 [Pisolithus thermaeus]